MYSSSVLKFDFFIKKIEVLNDYFIVNFNFFEFLKYFTFLFSESEPDEDVVWSCSTSSPSVCGFTWGDQWTYIYGKLSTDFIRCYGLIY